MGRSFRYYGQECVDREATARVLTHVRIPEGTAANRDTEGSRMRSTVLTLSLAMACCGSLVAAHADESEPLSLAQYAAPAQYPGQWDRAVDETGPVDHATD